MRKYRAYSEYLIEKYGEKTYKIPLNIKTSCPNRDENGKGGCIFCAEVGTGFESLSNELSAKEQLIKNQEYISKKYNANKFIAYLQNYTNTYLPLEEFKKIILDIVDVENVVEISISTRPDCINKDYLDFLKIIELKYGINISIELGLQTINNRSLKKLKRGHGVAAFIAAVNLIKQYKYEICVHLIPNLPWDNMEDVIEAAKMMNALEINAVKLHSLYVVKNTELAELYRTKEVRICNKYQYLDRVIAFLEHLDADIVIQRFFARAPKEETVFCNWKTSWWKLKDMLDAELEKRETYQGRLYEDLTTTGLKNIRN